MSPASPICSFASWSRRLRRPAATVFKLLAAAARARFVAPDLRDLPADRGQIKLQLGPVPVLRNAIARAQSLPHPAGCRAGRRRSARRMFAEEKLREGGEKVFEGLQIRRAPEEIMQDFVLNVRHQLDEHVVGLGLVLDERILLGVAAEINTFPQRIHRVQMLLPKPVDRIPEDVAFEALDRGRFFMARFAFVSLLDPADEELRVLFDTPRLELRSFPR